MVRTSPAGIQRGRLGRLFDCRTAAPDQREHDEYRRHERAGVPLDHYFPRLHGYVDTDLGRGLCFELLRGTDERPPLRLADYLSAPHAFGCIRPDMVLREFASFAAFCVQHRISAVSDGLENIGLLRHSFGYRLVSFDMKQRLNKELIAVSSISSVFRRRKIDRRLRRSLSLLEQQLAAVAASPAPQPPIRLNSNRYRKT